MKSKELALKAIETLPEDVSIGKIKEELDFIEGVEAGFQQIKEGKSVSVSEARDAVDSWFSKSSFLN